MEMPKIRELGNIIKSIVKFDYLDYKSTFLTAPGENYGSIMLKLDVECGENDEKQKLHFVAKLCPNNEVLKKAFLTDVTFKKEVDAYTNAVVSIKQFEMGYKFVEIRIDFFANCFGARLNLNNNNVIDEDAIILLENLKMEGYVTEDRLVGFNLCQADLIIKKLAQWHATVIAMKLADPRQFEENVLPCLMPVNVGSVMVNGFIDTAIHFAKKIKELEHIMERCEPNINKRKSIGGLEFPVETNRNFYTMIHTDLWTNNIMVKKDGDQTTNIKFIDLQLIEFGSAVRDLLFFLFTSVEINVLNEYLNYLINSYYFNFAGFLANFEFSFLDQPDFSWELFSKEVDNVAPHEFFHIIFMLKPIFSEKGSIESLDNISMDDFGRIDNVGQTYLDRLKFTIVTFAKKKWI